MKIKIIEIRNTSIRNKARHCLYKNSEKYPGEVVHTVILATHEAEMGGSLEHTQELKDVGNYYCATTLQSAWQFSKKRCFKK